MALTEQKLKAAYPVAKPYKLYDTDGLFVLVNPNGSVWWRLKYNLNGKQNALALGVYPHVDLLEARRRRDEARRLLAEGIDPADQRREAKQQAAKDNKDIFMAVAEEWLSKQANVLKEITLSKARWILNTFVYPAMGDLPVSKITAPIVLSALRKIEEQGHYETAQRTRHRIGQILRYAVATGRNARDVTVDLKGALTPMKQKHHRAVTEPTDLAPLATAIWAYQGKKPVQAALKLSLLLFVRPGELRQMEWSELNLVDNEWRIPKEKMKMDRPHIVPLARQAVEILTELHKETGCYQYVFPNDRGCIFPMSNGAITRALQRIGYGDKHSAHGFRATARTILDEVLGFRPEWVEMQLAHAVKDPNGEAYPRMKFLPQRAQMMQSWADYIDKLRSPAASVAMQHAQAIAIS